MAYTGKRLRNALPKAQNHVIPRMESNTERLLAAMRRTSRVGPNGLQRRVGVASVIGTSGMRVAVR